VLCLTVGMVAEVAAELIPIQQLIVLVVIVLQHLNLTVNQSPVIASAGNALTLLAYSTVAFNQPFSTATDNFTLETWVNWKWTNNHSK